MLKELRDLLDLFLFITNEFQGDQISGSRILPSYFSIRRDLIANASLTVHTLQMRRDLVVSLDKRFKVYINDPTYTLATFFDPNFVIDIFKNSDVSIISQNSVKELVINHMNIMKPSVVSEIDQSSQCSNYERIRNAKYKYFRADVSSLSKKNESQLIDDYLKSIRTIQSNKDSYSLSFWKINQFRREIIFFISVDET
jgi:hypothetical protein